MPSVVALLISLFTSISFADVPCDFFDKVEKQGVSNQPGFWEEFAHMQEKGKASAQDYETLLAKYKRDTQVPIRREVRPASLSSNVQVVRMRSTAQKKISSSPPQIQNKLNELVKILDGKSKNEAIHELKRGSWNYEYIDQNSAYSVRLNNGYRALIRYEGNEVVILDFGKQVYAH